MLNIKHFPKSKRHRDVKLLSFYFVNWPGFFRDLEVKYELKNGRKAKSPLIKKMKKYVKNGEEGTSFGDKLLREVLELPANFELDYFREIDTFYRDEIRKTQTN